MTGMIATTAIASLFYNTAAACIRYLYVRTSLQVHVQETIKRNQFIYKAMFLVESLNLFNLASMFLYQRGKTGSEKSTLLLYQTCLDPMNEGCSFLYFLQYMTFFLYNNTKNCHYRNTKLTCGRLCP